MRYIFILLALVSTQSMASGSITGEAIYLLLCMIFYPILIFLSPIICDRGNRRFSFLISAIGYPASCLLPFALGSKYFETSFKLLEYVSAFWVLWLIFLIIARCQKVDLLKIQKNIYTCLLALFVFIIMSMISVHLKEGSMPRLDNSEYDKSQVQQKKPSTGHIVCYSHNSNDSLYGIGNNMFVMGRVNLPGRYNKRGVFEPTGYAGKDISAEQQFKNICNETFPACKQGCWAGG